MCNFFFFFLQFIIIIILEVSEYVKFETPRDRINPFELFINGPTFHGIGTDGPRITDGPN